MRTRAFARLIRLTGVIALTSLMGVVPALSEARLLMFEEKWCEWCQMWNEDIGGIYGRTTEGKRAPLTRIDIHDPVPHRISLKTQVRYTPTFVLVSGGEEIGRIEGYPGEEFFWGMLAQLLDKLPHEPGHENATCVQPAERTAHAGTQ